jgi:hypothetical protein
MDQLKAWNASLQAGLAYSQREWARLAGDSGFFNEGYRKDLVKTALDEGWTDEDFTAVERIADLGRFRTMCDHYPGDSSVLNCIGLSQFSRGAKKFLDPMYRRRYGSLASVFIGYMRAMTSDGEYFSLRGEVLGAYFGSFAPIWGSCAAAPYQAKASALDSQLTARFRESDQLKKWDLERAIRQTLEDCRQ